MSETQTHIVEVESPYTTEYLQAFSKLRSTAGALVKLIEADRRVTCDDTTGLMTASANYLNRYFKIVIRYVDNDDGSSRLHDINIISGDRIQLHLGFSHESWHVAATNLVPGEKLQPVDPIDAMVDVNSVLRATIEEYVPKKYFAK